MREDANRFAAATLLGVMTITLVAAPLGGADRSAAERRHTAPAHQDKWKAPLTQKQQALLLLDRLTFGPRPGDLQRVEKMGLGAFLEEQLRPEALDDSALEARLASLWTLTTPPAELAADFPPPKAKQLQLRQKQLAALQKSQDNMQAEEPTSEMEAPRPGFRLFGPKPAPGSMQSKPDGAPAQPQGPRQILLQLGQEEVLRAVYSQRQLQEVMVHFWMNHFNVYWPKGADRFYLTSFEENVIRPRALGNFEDLLIATAESPAMLFYLDNWESVAPTENLMYFPGPLGAFRPAGPAANGKNRRGLNENYGREVMELHTVGLHYTQKDVTEVARCFTGWTIEKPGQGGRPYFNPRMHDYGEKVVLGHAIPAGRGIQDGLEVLHILATSPYTAQHIAYELCQQFVADNPPQDLVNDAAKTFLDTHGDIRSVLRTILTSPEFYSQGAYDAKMKSPFEYVASALRAFNAQTDGGPPLQGRLAQMGEPMFMYLAPSGYADVAATWINSGTLLQRMNFAIDLCLGRIPGTWVDLQAFPGLERRETPRGVMDDLAEALTGGEVSQKTETAILGNLSGGDPSGMSFIRPGQEARMIASLMVASPEFQRR